VLASQVWIRLVFQPASRLGVVSAAANLRVSSHNHRHGLEGKNSPYICTCTIHYWITSLGTISLPLGSAGASDNHLSSLNHVPRGFVLEIKSRDAVCTENLN
jgi:hypothetical protein